MQTTYHAYRFDISEPADRAAWDALKTQLTATHPHCMESHGGALHYQPGIDGAVLTLETSTVFDNQWNTAPLPGMKTGMRVFDWALDYEPNRNRYIKQGHYLDQTPEMAEVRRNIHKCGYCGAHEPAAKGYVFCPHCLDSEYLKEPELYLTRMRPAGESFGTKRVKLSAAESAHLVPLYRHAQLHGTTERGKARIAKARADLHTEYSKTTREATAKRDGFLWLMDHGINTANCIYYGHRDVFSFGWRQPVDEAFKSALLDVISEFPFQYEIKCDDGKTLNN